MTLQIPAYGWRPRDYQRPLWDFFEAGGKRAAVAWHRRSGKDDVALHWTAVSALTRVGDYWHMLPEASQARKAIWEATDPHKAKRRIDLAFPEETREVTRNNEMMIRFKNGSSWWVLGSDNFDSLVGTPPVGVVFSEAALTNPKAWGILRPILRENNGWALFISTPRGRANLFAKMIQGGEGWFTEILPAEQTAVFTPEELRHERFEYVRDYGRDEGEALYRQEYECSFEAPLFGSVYGSFLEELERQGKITSVPYDPNLKTITAWDLGRRDATSIWIAQLAPYGGEVRVIDHIEGSGGTLQGWIAELRRKPYNYYYHILPHDIETHESMTQGSRRQIAEGLGLRPMVVLERDSKAGWIEAGRSLMPRCVFDRDKTAEGRECLQNYRWHWDDKKHGWSVEPIHDWASHAADAFGHLARGLGRIPLQMRAPTIRRVSGWAA